MSKVKKAWGDPVGSKLIAELIKYVVSWGWGLLAIPVYAFFTSLFSDWSFLGTIKQAWNGIVRFFVSDFRINFLTILLFIIGYIVVAYLIRLILKKISGRAITSFNQANFWGADVSWKWTRKKGQWEIKYGDYQLVCPVCDHNLEFDDINGQHHLSCLNLRCNFRSQPYHYQAPSNVVIMADIDTYYFHNALESQVQAELRKRNRVK